MCVIFKYNYWRIHGHHSTQSRGLDHADRSAALLDMLKLRPGAKVGVAVHKGRLVVEPRPRPRYTLDELLAQCNRKGRRTKHEQEWLGDKPAGRELI